MTFKNGDRISHQHSKHFIHSDLLDDLCSRFIINLPSNDRMNLVRLFFHIEMAHWFYLDYYCDMYDLKPCSERKFASHIIHHVPDLHQQIGNLDTVLETWREYKRGIPTYGAILLDEDLSHMLLVQSFSAKASWSFPKGKVNEDEEPWICAAREVLEETGFDISKLLNKREYINAKVNRKTIRLYIITNVPHDTKFEPRTRKEIRLCQWFPINELPSNNKNMKTLKGKRNVSHNPFLLVIPFLKKLQRWVYEKNRNEITRDSCQHSMSSSEFSTAKTKVEISYELQNAVANYQEQKFSTPELQDAFKKFLQKNFPTHEPQNDLQYQHQDQDEMQRAYNKYLQHNQKHFDKLLNMETKNQQENLPYYKYQDGQLYQVQKSPMTANKSPILSANTHENNLSNLDKYYQQDIPTQQLKNALRINEQQDFSRLDKKQSQLYDKQCSPNTSHGWSKFTGDNNLSNSEEYYQQDLPCQKPKKPLMTYKHQALPHLDHKQSELYQEPSTPNNSHGWNTITRENKQSMNESKLATGRQLMTPSDFRSTNALQKEFSSDEYYTRLSNFVAPSWADFKFDRKAILDSMT